MQINFRNYQYSGSILNQRIPQFMIRKQNQWLNKLKISPQKYQFERSLQTSINKIEKNVNIKTSSLSQEVKNKIIIQQKPILYDCYTNNNDYIVNQKSTKINKRSNPQQTKIQQTMLQSDPIKICQQFRRFSERLNDSYRSRVKKQLKQQQQFINLSKDIEKESMGWSHRSSKSLI
ncbi:unnamed protein product [Paramecium sonneborni]|uniref:Uncharacterized protein n=1 Tax=Paramecium sonneborni TaxID=65129 RepID=A0A8S1KFW9_9CILI|nr:unnamed protein product [Paramecium sonneborni]